MMHAKFVPFYLNPAKFVPFYLNPMAKAER